MATRRCATPVLSQVFPSFRTLPGTPVLDLISDAEVMKTRSLLVLAVAFTLLMGGTAPSPLQRPDIQHDLAALTKRGFTYRMLDNDLIDLTDPVSGEKHLKTLREPGEAQIRSWAAERGVPILEIDPTRVDTAPYAGWYKHWAEAPLSNLSGIPLIVADFDKNGEAEVYGLYCNYTSNSETRAYELDHEGSATLRYNYGPLCGLSRQILNADGDSLLEVAFTFAGTMNDYTQTSTLSLPTTLCFSHDRYQGDLDPGYTGIFIGNLDGDSLTDFLYKGSEYDSSDGGIAVSKEYVAEFNRDSNNFVRVWSTQFVPGSQSTTAGFAVEDFDRDGRMDFTVTEWFHGRVFFAENNGDNSYAEVWQDSTPFVNLYYQTSGDVDADGWPEFFAAATMSNGAWVLVYEAVGVNNYSLKFLFHLLAGGTLDEPTLLTSDIDGDGKKELVIMSGAYLMVFKSRTDDVYYLWYLKREGTKDAVQVYDFDHNGIQDFVVSKMVLDSLGRGRFKSDIYLGSELVSVSNTATLPAIALLRQNFPNPFNPQTTMEYALPSCQRVRLNIYNVLGQHVANLADGEQGSGLHRVTWDGRSVSSGIYFCRLETDSRVFCIKLLLLR